MLERFKYEYDVSNLKQIISSEKTSQFSDRSDAEYLAMRFAEIGAEGLRDTEKDIALKAQKYSINFSQPYKINQSDLSKLGYNYHMVVVGTALEFAGDTARRGVLRKPEYVRDYNDRAKGGRFNLLYSDPLDTQVIENKQWEEMRRFVEENPTLSAFLTTGYNLMPNFIQWHIGQAVNLEFVRSRIVPAYDSVASRLLTSS